MVAGGSTASLKAKVSSRFHCPHSPRLVTPQPIDFSRMIPSLVEGLGWLDRVSETCCGEELREVELSKRKLMK